MNRVTVMSDIWVARWGLLDHGAMGGATKTTIRRMPGTAAVQQRFIQANPRRFQNALVVDIDRASAVMDALEHADWQDGAEGAKRALASLTREPETPSHLSPHRAEIDRCFTGMGSVERVIAALEHGDAVQKAYGRDTANWFTATRDALAKRSPTSLKVTFEQQRRGATLSFDECMVMEYRMSQAAMRPGSDFYEGIRAVLIDKDNAPRWNPATPDAVTDHMIDTIFAPLPDDEQWTPLP